MEDEKIIKLLLLGAGGCGKSTLFKQMLLIYGKEPEMDMDMKEKFKRLVFSNVIINAQALAEASYKFGEPETPEGKAARDVIEELSDDAIIGPDEAKHMDLFWKDAGIQKTYDNRSSFQLEDSTPYFFPIIMKIGEPDWLPTVDDTLRVRVKTTGIVEHNFEIDENPFQMYDVGGQRSERKKWIHCFDDVTALMFVCAMSAFDQNLYEDEKTNRITESLQLFDDVSNSDWFVEASIILFLNKMDLFIEKIAVKDLQDSGCEALQAFDGNPRDFDDTSEHMVQCFMDRYSGDKRIYHHVTMATDTENVKHVFDDVKDMIIAKELEGAGLE